MGGSGEFVYLILMDYLWTPWRYAYLVDADRDPLRGGRKGVPRALADWPGDCDCVFCNLIAATRFAAEHGMSPLEADRAANIVARAEHCFICLNAFPYSTGHVMIVPYAHQESLESLEQPAALEMMTLARCTDSVLRQVYAPQGINMGLNLGQAAGAGIAAHLHMHALPRWVGDSNFMTVIAETRVLPETLDITWQRLREAYDGRLQAAKLPPPKS
ncbi:MAG: HIT domain-containing protein [Acidobacteriaceae bacterium]